MPCLLLNTKQLLTLCKCLFHPSLAFSLIKRVSFLLIKESGRRTAEGSSELGMLANVPLIWGVLQFKCTFLSWASLCVKPIGYRQGYCQHVSPKYSAEQQVQNGHHVIFAGKLFNNVLRKCKLQLRESWVPQLKLIFSSSYWKFRNINVLNSKASFFLVSQLSSLSIFAMKIIQMSSEKSNVMNILLCKTWKTGICVK